MKITTAHSFSHCFRMSRAASRGGRKYATSESSSVLIKAFKADGRRCDAKASFLAQEPSEGQAEEKTLNKNNKYQRGLHSGSRLLSRQTERDGLQVESRVTDVFTCLFISAPDGISFHPPRLLPSNGYSKTGKALPLQTK